MLIGTAGRTAEVPVTLAGLAAQDGPAFRVTVGDQSDDHLMDADPAVRAMLRVLAVPGRDTHLGQSSYRRRHPSRGANADPPGARADGDAEVA